MSTARATPYTPRVRCWRCKGRRVIDVGILEVELVPCPSCHHRDPKGARANPAPAPDIVLARAA